MFSLNMMFKSLNKVFFSLITISTLFASQEVKESLSDTVKITGEEVVCEKSNNTCTISGNPKVERLFSEGIYTLRSKELKVFFLSNLEKEAPKDAGEKNSVQSKVKEIYATHEVVFTKQDLTITCDQAIYSPTSDMIHLEGNVKITEKKNYLEGNKGQVNIKTGEYKITQGHKPVTIIIDMTKENK